MDNGKIIITIDYKKSQAFALRDIDQAAKFWKGYISQVRGHKVLNVEVQSADF